MLSKNTQLKWKKENLDESSPTIFVYQKDVFDLDRNTGTKQHTFFIVPRKRSLDPLLSIVPLLL